MSAVPGTVVGVEPLTPPFSQAPFRHGAIGSMAPPEAPCNRCPHQFRHHAVTVDGYRCRGCKCKRSHWR